MDNIEKRIDNYLEQLEDSIQDQLSFEDPIHGMREDDFYNHFYTIESYIKNYNNEIDFITILNIPEENEEVEFEEAIMDIASSVESIVERHNTIKKLKKVNSNIENLINDNIYYSLIGYLKIQNIDLLDYKEEISNISDIKNSYDVFKNIIFNNINNKIKSLFNESNLNKNSIYKKYNELLKKEYEDKYNKLEDKEEYRFYNNANFFRDLESLSKPFIESILTLKKYKHLYNNYKNLNKNNPDYFNIENVNDIEEIDDFMQAVIERNQIKLYAKRFLGSYLKLMNEESYDIFKIMKEKDIPAEKIREGLSNIALYESSEILNYSLKNIIKEQSPKNKIVEDIKNTKENIEILKVKDLLVIKINDFHASSAFGSSKWCISTSESYYNRYLKSENAHHIFVYNLAKEESDPLSKIAFTINNGEITDCFNNKDINIKNHLLEGKIINSTLIENILSTYGLVNDLNKKEKISLIEIKDFYNPIDFLYKKNIEKLFDKISDKQLVYDIIELSIKNDSILSNQEKINEIIKFSKYFEVNPLGNKMFKKEFEKLESIEKILLTKKHEEILSESKNISKKKLKR